MDRSLLFFLPALLAPCLSLSADIPELSHADLLRLLVDNANYDYRQALGNGPRKGPQALQDPEKALLAKAADYWKRAIRLEPPRLDLRFDLARLYQDLGDFEAQYAILSQAVQYADKNRKKLEWADGEDLPERSSELIPEVLQECAVHYFDRKDPEDDEKALRLMRLSITYFPNHPYAYNSIAIYFFNKKDWPRTLKYFLIANQKDPRDGLVLGNIACLLGEMGKKEDAKIYWRKVLELDNDPELVAQAKQQLAELDTR